MGKRKKSMGRSGKRRSASPGDAPASRGGRDEHPQAARGRFRSWVHTNRSDLRFLLIFGACLVVYYAATLTPPVKSGFFPAYLRLNASVSGVLLRVVGQDVTVEDQAIASAQGPSIKVERGCDAIAPSALFVSAVLASPVPLISRLLAAVAGSVLLMLLNLVRVISLYLVRVYYPRAFDVMHLDVWQALFIVLALLLWAVWASRASKQARQHHATP